MGSIVVVSASPSPQSKTARLGDLVARELRADGWTALPLRLRELPAAALLSADLQDAALAEAVQMVSEASGIVLATPVFKASFSGLLKVFLDVLPQFGFAGKVVLPLATGGSLAHVLALDYGLRPVVQSMNPAHIVQSFFVLDKCVVTAPEFGFQEDCRPPFDAALQQFKSALRAQIPQFQLEKELTS